MPARWGTSAGVPRIWTPPSRSAARWCAGTGSWCRLAPGSWPTRIRHASSGRPRTRRRPCSRRWRSPRPEGEVYLAPVFKLLSTTGEQSIDLQPGRNVVVGRAVTSDVPIYDPTISRRHAEVSLTDGGVKVKDAGSSNGTFLNGARITEAIAVENDVITFGKVAFRVKEVSAPVARPQVVPSVSAEFTGAKPADGTVVGLEARAAVDRPQGGRGPRRHPVGQHGGRRAVQREVDPHPERAQRHVHAAHGNRPEGARHPLRGQPHRHALLLRRRPQVPDRLRLARGGGDRELAALGADAPRGAGALELPALLLPQYRAGHRAAAGCGPAPE